MKLAVHVLIILGVCVAAVRPCPNSCSCGPYRDNQNEFSVDCSGKGFQTVPQNLPANTRALNLANNQLTAISGSDLPSFGLRELDLRNNQIAEIPQGAIKIDGNCNLDDFVYNDLPAVPGGNWDLLNLTEAPWPCLVDLRNNPITKVSNRAFTGSRNFTVFLGGSKVGVTIETSAFHDTDNVIGLHISDLPSVSFEDGALDDMGRVGWIVVDKTNLTLDKAIFSSGTSTRPQRIRISNSDVLQLTSEALAIPMETEFICHVKTYSHGPNKITTEASSTIKNGAIEIVNNTLPILPRYLIRGATFGGIYFLSNKIAGIRAGAFGREANEAEMCMFRFSLNIFDRISSSAFRELRNVVHVIFRTDNVHSIESDAFAYSSNIGSLSIHIRENEKIEHVTVKARAFTDMNRVKIFSLSKGSDTTAKPKLLIEPYAFDGLRNVDYMSIGIYEDMPELPNNLFTGLQVNQKLTLWARDLKRINQEAFGIQKSRTYIRNLEVFYLHDIPCDCETAALNANMKVTVGNHTGLTCSAPFPDGTMSHSWHLDHATCAACSLPVSVVWLVLIACFFNL